MKKKYYIWIGVVILLLIAGAVAFVTINRKAPAKASKKVDITKLLGNKEKELGKDTDNIEDISVDTNPNSITVLVNKEYSIPENYKPNDLVEPNIKFSFDYADEKRKVRKETADNLELLFQSAKKEGYDLLAVSGYRSYKRQKTIYEYNLLNNGFEYTQIYSAMAGTSEHQTGLAIDISCSSIQGMLSDKFGDTKEGKWVSDNCYKYGFIIRYPKNKSNVTGYGYEPWHIRYVGKELAKYLYDNNITLDEYYGYALNSDMVDRGAYAYYDYLLTMKHGGYPELSVAELDDVVDKNNVDVSNSKPVIPDGNDTLKEDNYDNIDDVGDSVNIDDNDSDTTVDDPNNMFDNQTTPKPTKLPVTAEPTVSPTEKPSIPTNTETPKETVVPDKDTPDTTEENKDSNHKWPFWG